MKRIVGVLLFGAGAIALARPQLASAFEKPLSLPTPVPITLAQSSVVLAQGAQASVQAFGIAGTFRVTVDHPQVVEAVPDQAARRVLLSAKGLGNSVLTLTDARGMSASFPVLVEASAGTVAASAAVKITGAPASPGFVAGQAAHAAAMAARALPGAQVRVVSEELRAPQLDLEEITEVAVPVRIEGPGLYPVEGVTRVRVENFAQPQVHPSSLLVSDFPERLHEDGLLYTTQLQPRDPTRILFYHANPHGQPPRWIVLQLTNHSNSPATVMVIDGHGGANPNEMLVGHLATKRFLVHQLQNEGVLVEVPAQSTVAVVSRSLPPDTVISDLLQLNEIEGDPLALALIAEQTPAAQPNLDTMGAWLTDRVRHARGRYPIPELFYEATYDTQEPELSIPIGQLPLPNLRQGIALDGDYGVLFSVNATLLNTSNSPAEIALYATPRGGRAAGTFLIDHTLIQAHALPAFSHYKLKQYTVPAHGFLNTSVVTMPEGGSSYPLDLIFAPDDGSPNPGAPGSLMY